MRSTACPTGPDRAFGKIGKDGNMPLNLANSVLEFLQQNSEKKFTALEIAAWILQTYPDECREKRKRSQATAIPNQAALLRQIAAEIASKRPRLEKRQPEVKTTEGRPRKYHFTKVSDDAEIEHIESDSAALASKNNNWAEHNL